MHTLVLLTLFVPMSVHSADVTLSCGDGNWRNRQEVTLTCIVIRTNYRSKCVSPSGADGKVYFRLSSNPRCTVNDVTACSGGNTATDSCRCIQQDAGQYVLEYKFIAGYTHNGTWDCDVPCFDGPNQVLTFSGETCKNKFVVENSGDQQNSGDQHAYNIFLMVIGLTLSLYWASA